MIISFLLAIYFDENNNATTRAICTTEWKKKINSSAWWHVSWYKIWYIDNEIVFSQTWWDPRPTGKNKPKIRPGEEKLLKFYFPYWESDTIPAVKFRYEFAVPTGFFGLKTMEINFSSYKINRILSPLWSLV